jgi:hypothetical protein
MISYDLAMIMNGNSNSAVPIVSRDSGSAVVTPPCDGLLCHEEVVNAKSDVRNDLERRYPVTVIFGSAYQYIRKESPGYPCRCISLHTLIWTGKYY